MTKYIIMLLNNSLGKPGKRKTSKWIPLINHRKLWICAILVKEKVNEKYWLLWWWIDPGEKEEDALRRELREEIGSKCKIERIKNLITLKTKTQIHNVFALKLWWEFRPAKNEIAWFAFYPLENKYSKERKAISKNMEPYAEMALYEFRHNHDRRSYEVSSPRIEWKYFDQFHRELDSLKEHIM